MPGEARMIRFDADLHIEACCFHGLLQDFPTHFHEHYVIGCMDGGRRRIFCNNREYTAKTGDLLLFNPRDKHACSRVGEEPLSWRALHVGEEAMHRLNRRIAGGESPPMFAPCLVPQSGLAPLLRDVHAMIVEGFAGSRKEELFFSLLGALLEGFAAPLARPASQVGDAPLRVVRDFLEEHYAERVSLDDLSRLAGLDKYCLLRAFTRVMGITPYRYLENVRIARAKALLEAGVAPVEAALSTGFTDQSHFTKFLKRFTGLTPRQCQRVPIPTGH